MAVDQQKPETSDASVDAAADPVISSKPEVSSDPKSAPAPTHEEGSSETSPGSESNEPLVETSTIAETDTPAADTETAEASVEAAAGPEVEAAVEAESPSQPEVVAAVESPAEPADEALAEPQAETPNDSISSADADSTENVIDDEPEPEKPIKAFTGMITGLRLTLEQADKEDLEDEVELDQDLLKLYESSMTSVEENEIVSGRIVTIGEKDVVIDIGFKSDGIISKNEFDGEINKGDEVRVYLERIEDRHGQLVLSKRRADELSRWQLIEDAHENDSIVEGEIINRIKGGMIVNLYGTEAFLPGSQIDIRPVRDFDAYLGKRMEFKVVKINPMNGNVVVSHKALIEKDLNAQRDQILSTMEAGQVIEGAVKNITDFGVFIDLGGVDGLLHITDLSWGRVGHPSEVVDLDQKLKVVVLDYDKERQRISLGLKQLTPHPWDAIAERFGENSVVQGTVVSITDYGAFVELEKGIEGLVHISEMSWTQHIKHPTEVVSMGDTIDVKVLKIDQEGRKISLGIKQMSPDPWEQLSDRFPAGTVVKGIVRNLTNFGVFVEIDQGIDGLVHISDLSWTKKIRHPGEIVKKGQELDVLILSVDVDNRRLSLGHKQIETNPWNQFENAYPEGTDTSARIVRFLDNGIIVLLPLDVEAFVPGSHLIRNARDLAEVYDVDEELDLRVIEFNFEDRKIVLSERAKKAAEEKKEKQSADRARKKKGPVASDTAAVYRRKSTSGSATLGELSGLDDLKRKMERAESAAAVEPEEEIEPTVATDETVEEPVTEATEPETIAEAEIETPVEDESTGSETEAAEPETIAEAETETPVEDESTDSETDVTEAKPKA
ncbi:30S ribosomal protein S1 [Bacteroidota bacterium]